MNRTTALIATAALVATPLATLVAASPASADVTKRGTCAGGSYEFQVEREDGGYEASLDLDRVAPGSRWELVIRHDGQRAARVTRTADREGDVDLDVTRRDTAGQETFRFRATTAGGVACKGTITVG